MGPSEELRLQSKDSTGDKVVAPGCASKPSHRAGVESEDHKRGKRHNLKKQKMTKGSIRIFGFTQTLGKGIIVTILTREVQLYVPRKESYPAPLSYFDVTRSTHAHLENVQENKCMTIWMSTRTEICKIRGRVSQYLRYCTKLL